MSRFNRGARRVVDERGRFIRVSKDDFERLKSVAEEERVKGYDRSSFLSPTETIPEGWRPKRDSSDEGSRTDGSPSKPGTDGASPLLGDGNNTLERDPRFNPTVARVQAKGRSKSGRFNEIEQMIAGGDMELLENELFLSQSNEYHSFKLLFAALKKQNKPIEELCKTMVQDVERLEGKALARAMDKFVVEFCGSCSCTNYAGLMALITIFSGFNLKEKEGSIGFKHARRLLRAWRDYAVTETDTVELEGWLDMCQNDQITGSLGGDVSTYNSPGFLRMHTPCEEHQFTVDFFLQGLTAYIGFEQVNKDDARVAHEEFFINVEVERARGVAHSMRQGEDTGYAEWIEQFESRLEDLDKAVEETGDEEYFLNESQVMSNFKEALSKSFWLKVSKLLEERSLVWKNLTLDEAKRLCADAARLKEIKDANAKVFRNFGGGSNRTDTGKKIQEGKKIQDTKKVRFEVPAVTSTIDGGNDTRRKKYPCRFFEAGRCEKGDDCPFLHVVKGFEFPNPRNKEKKGSEVKMMRVIDSEEESEEREKVAEGVKDCSPMERDDARWRLRMARKFNQEEEEGLEELAELELDRSMRMDEDPINHKRVPKQRDTEGYAMLGSYVDQDAVDTIEGRQALLDSSMDGDESMDLESSGSDREVTVVEEKMLRKKYRTLMDIDARQMVELRAVADSGGVGDLMVSTNSDAFQEMKSTVSTVHMMRAAKHSKKFMRQLEEKREKGLRVLRRHNREVQEDEWYGDAAMEALEAMERDVAERMVGDHGRTFDAENTWKRVYSQVVQLISLVDWVREVDSSKITKEREDSEAQVQGRVFAGAAEGCELEGIIGYHLKEDGETQMIIAFDTQAGPSVVDMSIDVSGCTVTKRDKLTILGAGGTVTDAGTECVMNMVLGYNSDEYPIPVRQMPLRAHADDTGGADMLVGVKEQRSFIESVSVRRSEVNLRVKYEDGSGFRQIIQTHPIGDMKSRMSGKPLVVVSLGDGAGTAYVALQMMGFQVDEYHAVEMNEIARSVADANSGGRVRRDVLGHDVMELTRAKLDRLKRVDLLIMTPDCGPWSSLLDDPPGFESEQGGSLFIKCGEVKDDLLENNNEMLFWCETNCVSDKKGEDWCRDQELQQEAIMGVEAVMISALSLGAGASRFRRFFSNSEMSYDFIEAANPDDSMNLWWTTVLKPAPCQVATEHTKRQTWLRNEQTGELRLILADERDRLMGYYAGVSNGCGSVDLTEVERLMLTGKMICFQHYKMMFSKIEVNRREKVIVMSGRGMEGQEPDPEKLREFIRGLIRDHRLNEWIKVQRGDYEPLTFKLNVDPSAENYKTDRIFDVPENMADAVEAKMKSMEAMGQFVKVLNTSAEDWEHPMFFSMKEGRTDPRTNAPDCRILCACVYLNAHNKPAGWMLEFSPTVGGFLNRFSKDDTEFANVDDWDAFQNVKCEEGSQRYLHFVFRMRGKVFKYRALCMVQGCNTSALFYPLYKYGIFDRIIGRVWQVFWAIYQDDTIVKGKKGTGNTALQLELLLAIYEEFGLPVSPKCFGDDGKIPITDEVKGAGFMIGRNTGEGVMITCNDSLHSAIEVLLTKVIRSEKQLRSMINTLIQAHAGFKFDSSQISVFGTEMAHLQRALKSVTTGGGVQYKEIIKPACDRLKKFLGGMPRVQCMAEELIDDDHCLIYLGDVGNTGKGMNVYRVAIADARDVIVPDDLEDTNMSQLVRCYHGVISQEKLDWMTWENETDNVVESLVKTGSMLVTATMGYPRDGQKKVGVYSDASAAVLGCSNLFVPDGKLEFLTAKSRKVAHWRDDIAWTEMIPIWFAGIPGHKNSFADFLSHVHDELVTRSIAQKSAKNKPAVKVLLMPVADSEVMKRTEEIKGKVAVIGNDATESDKLTMPTGYRAAKMLLSDDEWAEVCSKYETSKSEMRDVSLAVIYDVLVNGGSKASKLEKKKVMGWKHRIIPVEVGDGDVALFVKAPVHCEDEVDWAEPVEETDEALIKLVLLVPEGAMVRVTAVPTTEQEKDPESYRYRDLRMDMLVMAHEFQLHAKVGLMYLFITQRMWFPELVAMIKQHIKECGLCQAKSKASRLAGHGMVSVCTYRHVGADHVIPPQWLRDLVNVNGILMVTDRASGKIAVEVQEKLTAEATAVGLYIGWIQHNGLMRTLTTDQGSPFTAEVFEILRRLMGVKVHNVTSVGNSVALGDTEVENKWIQKVISEAGSKGDVVDLTSFKLYLARCVIERNQIMVTAGSTVFERIHGFAALTVGDVIMDPTYMDKCEGRAEKMENTIAPVMAKHAQELLEAYQVQSNERNYKAAFDRDSKVQHKRLQNTVFEKGSKVTWLNNNNNPEKGVVTNVEVREGVPMAAWVDIGGQIKKVQYNALKELAAVRPQFLVDLEIRLEEGMIAFWQDEDDELVGAMVMNAGQEEEMQVHYYEPTQNLRKWLPLWQTADGSECERKAECPKGWKASVEAVPKTKARRSGFLKDSGFLTEDTLLMLQAWLQE